MRPSIKKNSASSSTCTPTKGLLQRQCAACGQHTIAGGTCHECGKKRELQRHTTQASEFSGVPSIVQDVLNSSGQPLDANTRTRMESRFGQDFSHVQVHRYMQTTKRQSQRKPFMRQHTPLETESCLGQDNMHPRPRQDKG